MKELTKRGKLYSKYRSSKETKVLDELKKVDEAIDKELKKNFVDNKTSYSNLKRIKSFYVTFETELAS